MRDKKKIIISILLILICIMTISYAYLAQQLQITGTTTIASTWKVEITNIEEKEKTIGATTRNIEHDTTTATFNVGLTSPGDYAIYEIEVSNLGTLDAIIKNINIVNSDARYMQYTLLGISEENYLLANNTKLKFSVKVEYRNDVSSQPSVTTSTLMVSLNCVESYGNENTNNNTNDVTVYSSYEPGDQVTFAGSQWYVLESSDLKQDYVTVLKKDSLTAQELGNYAPHNIFTCSQYNVNNSYVYNGTTCTEVNQVIVGPPSGSMPYYWSETCHNTGVYGNNVYTSSTTSGCNGQHNEYEGSKVKEFLEEEYLNNLESVNTSHKDEYKVEFMENSINSTNLKEIDGYKIRLISLSDLQKFGFTATPQCSSHNCGLTSNYNSVRPSWFNGNYWTMASVRTEYSQYSSYNRAWYVESSSVMNADIRSAHGIRPVINLYKSAIED